MKRGDVVVVVATGDYGKPRPAIIVQTDLLPETYASVIICQMTSQRVDTPDFRVTIAPSPENGLREPSQVMVDKPVTIRCDRVGQVIGRLNAAQMAQVNTAIALVMGLAD
ncbi:MAG: type II toxin-antitoxin system PemK/MazF family toxin [Niveispirillum sp.]|nr:type II toxin-antitoxin system PemK/MazF family toxin [Niveispirillum sp.]